MKKLAAIFATLTPEQQRIAPRPTPPRGCPPESRSLIAHNERGELVGYEDA